MNGNWQKYQKLKTDDKKQHLTALSNVLISDLSMESILSFFTPLD